MVVSDANSNMIGSDILDVHSSTSNIVESIPNKAQSVEELNKYLWQGDSISTYERW